MRIMVLILSFLIAPGLLSATSEELPPAAKHIHHLALQGKWLELQQVKKKLLAKDPLDLTGLILKAAEAHSEFRKVDFHHALSELKKALAQSGIEEPKLSRITLLSHGILTRIAEDASLSGGQNAFERLTPDEQKKLLNMVHSGGLPMLAGSFSQVFGLLESEGKLTFDNLDISILYFPFVTYVENEWNRRPDGWKRVSAIADKLLEYDPDHIGGLLLKVSYGLKALRYDQIQKTVSQIEKVGDRIKTKRFMKAFPILKKELQRRINYAATESEPAVNARKESLKKNGNGGQLTFKRFLLECEEDGLVSMADLEDRNLSGYYWTLIPLILLAIGFAAYLRRKGRKDEDVSA